MVLQFTATTVSQRVSFHFNFFFEDDCMHVLAYKKSILAKAAAFTFLNSRMVNGMEEKNKKKKKNEKEICP